MSPYPSFVRDRFLPPNECVLIRALHMNHVHVHRSGNQSHRFVDLSDSLLHGQVMAFMRMHNPWRFKITGLEQPVRFQTYEEGDHFDWHNDHNETDGSKLAMCVLLQRAAKGGVLQIQTRDAKHKSVLLRVGEAVVFPAYAVHRITPIEQGTRHVLLAWATGPRFV